MHPLLKLCCALWIVSAALIVASIIVGHSPKDETDPKNGLSGLALLTDAGTGCQYLGNAWSGITPRLDASGTQICNAEGK